MGMHEKLVCQQLSWAGDMTGIETRFLTSQLRKTCLWKHLSDDVGKLSGSAFVTTTDIKCNHFYIAIFFKLINKNYWSLF